MGRATRQIHAKRMSQEKLNSLISNPAPIVVEHEPVDPHPILSSEESYDTLDPEETIRSFSASIREMLSRYDGNQMELQKLDNQMQDLLHYIEMSKDKKAPDGYKLYKQLRDIRRKRRACKNEIDLLKTVYDIFNGTDLLNKLADALGKVRETKRVISARTYKVRTDVLDGIESK